MAINRNKTTVHFEKVFLLCIRTIYRSAGYHPFVFSLVLFLLVFYISFPSLFAFLVSSSPVIVCTTLLLGLLLSYGEPYIPEIEDESKRTLEVPSVRVGNTSNHQYVMEDENLSNENHVENRNYNAKTQLRETILFKENATAREDINQASELHDGNKILHMIVEPILSTEDEVQKENYEAEVIQEELHGRTISKDRNLHVGGLGDVAEVDENTTSLYIEDKQEKQNLELHVDEPPADNHFYSSLGLPLLSVGGNRSSDSESDRAESSSPDASMADIIPMLDELHPLLNSEHPQHVSASKSDAASDVSTLDHEIDDNSVYEEDEKDGEIRDGEALKDTDDGAVKWTEDDQKNVMDLGSSELERDQRLESLIANRRARKNLTFRMDRNLIDWDTNETFLTLDELSRFRVQVPARRNPFDSPDGSDGAMDLPPIPGSAPSSLLHRRNPFDLFYDQKEQDSSLTGETLGHQDLVSAPHREMLLRGNEPFGLGKREMRQKRRHSRLKPYFVAEKKDSEMEISTFQRQFSDKSDSKVSSIPKSDAVSSATDQDFSKELQEYESQQESELPSLAKHNADGGDRESHTSEGESVDIEEKETRQLINSLETDENAYHIIQGSDQVVGYLGAVKEDTREKNYQNFPTSESEKLEVIEQKHDESNTCSSVEDHNIFATFQQASNLHEPEAVNNINDISFFLSSAKSREFDPIHVDVSCGLEGEEMVVTKVSSPTDVLILPDDSALSEFQKSSSMEKYSSSSHGIGGEETQVSTLDLYSISEENQDYVEPKKDDPSYSNHDQIDHLTGFPLHENLMFLGSNTAQQIPFFHNPRLEISHMDDDVKILHEPESSTSCISPVIPIQEYGSGGSQLVELSESTDSIALDMSEIIVHSIHDLSRLVVDIKSPVLVKHELGTSEMLDSSEEESDVVHNLVLENDGIDDTLPADNDGAVFFSPDQQSLDLMFQNDRQSETITSTSRIFFDHDYKFSENTSTQYADMLVNSSSSQLLEESLTSDVSEFVSGESKTSRFVLESTGIDTSQANMNRTLTITDLPVVETRFSEDIYLGSKQISEESRPVAKASLVQKVDSGFNRLPEEAMVPTTVSDSDIDKPTLPKLVIESSVKDSEDSALSIVEARSLDDITAAFIHVGEGTFDKPLHLDSGFRNSPGNAFLDAMLIQSDLHVVEAKSIEDIDEAFSQLSHSITTKAKDPNGHVHNASLVQEVDPGSKHLSEEAMAPSVSESDIKMPTPVELLESNEKDRTDSELPVVEARSLEDIREAFIQISEGTRDKPFHHDSCSVNSQGNSHMDVMLIQSDLHVVEAKSIEDIDEAFSQLSHNITRKAPEKIDPNVHVLESLVQEVASEFNEFPDEAIVPSILESGIDKPAPLILVLESSEKGSTDSELPVVEARSLEDIAAAFIQISEGSLSKPLHHDSGSQNSSGNPHMDSMLMQSDLHVVEAKSIEDIDEAFSQFSNRYTRKAPEKIDLNMHVLEASLVQEVDSGFNQFPEEAILPSVSDSHVNKPTSRKLVLESSVKDRTDIELPLVEARSLEDISEAFIQISEGSHDKPFHHDSDSQKSPGTVHLDAMLMQSDLHVVDAKSIEEIDEVFWQLSHNKTRKASEQMKKAAETDTTGVLEVHNSDEINLTFNVLSVSEASLSIEKAGVETIGDAVAAVPLNLSKQKKHWHNKSASSSSSSSSSSDSEISENKQYED